MDKAGLASQLVLGSAASVFWVRITDRLPHPWEFAWVLRVWGFQFSHFLDKHSVTALAPQPQSWTVCIYLLSFAHFMLFKKILSSFKGWVSVFLLLGAFSREGRHLSPCLFNQAFLYPCVGFCTCGWREPKALQMLSDALQLELQVFVS